MPLKAGQHPQRHGSRTRAGSRIADADGQSRRKQQSGYHALVDDGPCPEQAIELKYSIGSLPGGAAVTANALGRAGKGHSMRASRVRTGCP
jgi:hypothetical protein